MDTLIGLWWLYVLIAAPFIWYVVRTTRRRVDAAVDRMAEASTVDLDADFPVADASDSPGRTGDGIGLDVTITFIIGAIFGVSALVCFLMWTLEVIVLRHS